MKEKLLAALKTKYANLGFTDKAFDGVANFLVATVTEDSQVDNAVSGVEPLLKSFQGDVDSRVNAAIEKTKKEMGVDPPKPGDPNQPNPPAPPAGETPSEKLLRETLESITAQNKLMADRLEKIENGGVQTNRQTAIETALKDAPEGYKIAVLGTFDPTVFKDDEAFNNYVTKVTTTNLEAFNTKMGEQGVQNLTAAPITGIIGDSKGATLKDSMKAGVDHLLAKKAEGQQQPVVK